MKQRRMNKEKHATNGEFKHHTLASLENFRSKQFIFWTFIM
jgi:hypothetical protein